MRSWPGASAGAGTYVTVYGAAGAGAGAGAGVVSGKYAIVWGVDAGGGRVSGKKPVVIVLKHPCACFPVCAVLFVRVTQLPAATAGDVAQKDTYSAWSLLGLLACLFHYNNPQPSHLKGWIAQTVPHRLHIALLEASLSQFWRSTLQKSSRSQTSFIWIAIRNMAAPAIVASAIQALGKLPPVRLVLLAVSAISLTALSVYSLASGDYSSPYLTKRGFRHPFITTEVKAICQIHYRIWNADPIHEPETFFDILDLDSSRKPFVDNTWLTEGESSHHEAQEIIMEKWAERRNRLRGWRRVISFQDQAQKRRQTARSTGGDLQRIWGAPQFKKKKEL
ncbi:hypothetical protein FPHYL_4566 [Fusarium phyllophilum]|uniref:Uncharacterized protein n=1 Tax=Fusarium phyllophilum TaxID=47803 RepID=A0A8H5K0U5_9HYPO|nr:hypothetical protein FPHYL_4566 [Fusarium phyllophilum]